jgi:hypothetical protein
MAEQFDMFTGEAVETGSALAPSTRDINDMDAIQDVLDRAVRVGYMLVGANEQVYRKVQGSQINEIERVSINEAELVHQLIRQKYLTVGGNHHCVHGRSSGPANSVLVPRDTRHRLSRWHALKRPTTWPQRKTG